MRRKIAVLGSLALHGAVVAGFAWLRDPEPAAESTDPNRVHAIELVEIAPQHRTSAAGGGSSAARAPAPLAAKRAHARAIRVATATVTAPSHADPGGARGDGGGIGGGHGIGIGLGTGANLEIPDLPPPPPRPAVHEVASRARPAKLIYPSREREVEDSRLYVARVVVDHEGYVVGAHLVRGFGGRGDDQAADLVWRFRYAPALDDAGRAIRSTVDQRFMIR